MLIFLNVNLRHRVDILTARGCMCPDTRLGGQLGHGWVSGVRVLKYCFFPLYNTFARMCVRVCLVFISPIRLNMNHAFFLYRAFARVCVRVCLVFFLTIGLNMNHAADAQ